MNEVVVGTFKIDKVKGHNLLKHACKKGIKYAPDLDPTDRSIVGLCLVIEELIDRVNNLEKKLRDE